MAIDKKIKGITKQTQDLLTDTNKQLESLRSAMGQRGDLETATNNLIKQGYLQQAALTKKLLDKNNAYIESNQGLVDIILRESAIREQEFIEEQTRKSTLAAEAKAAQDAIILQNKAAQEELIAQEKAAQEEKDKLATESTEKAATLALQRAEAEYEASHQLFVLGDEATMFGKAMRSLDERFNTLANSSGLVGDFFESLTNTSRKILLSFSTSAALLGGVTKKYADAMLEGATYLPTAIKNSGLIESGVHLGTMMAQSGLSLDQLTSQMRSNRVAWEENGDQISNFISDNEALRIKLGETREGFAEAAARAATFLTNQGVQQQDLAKETGRYLTNLHKVAVQTGRQAAEVEASRREATKATGDFILQFSGDTRAAMIGMVKNLDDQVNGNNGVAQILSSAFQEGDVGSRLAAAAKESVGLRDVGIRAGISAEMMDELIESQRLAILGDAAAAKRMAELSNEVGSTINTFAQTGALYDVNIGRPLSNTAKVLGDFAMKAAVVGDSQNVLQNQLNKAAENAGTALDPLTKTPLEDILTTFSKWSNSFSVVGGDVIQTLMGLASSIPGFMTVIKQIPLMGGAISTFMMGLIKLPFKALGFAMKAAMGPFGLLLTVLAGIPLLIENWDSIKAAFSDIPGTFNKLKEMFATMFPDAAKVFDEWIATPISNFFSKAFSGETGDSSGFFQKWVVNPLTAYLQMMFDVYGKVGNLFVDYVYTPLRDWLLEAFDISTDVDIGAAIKSYTIDPLMGMFKFIGELFSIDGLRKLLPTSLASLLPKQQETIGISPVEDRTPVKTTIEDLQKQKAGQEKLLESGKLPEAARLAIQKSLDSINTQIADQGAAQSPMKPMLGIESLAAMPIPQEINTPSIQTSVVDPQTTLDTAARIKQLEADVQSAKVKESTLQDKVSSGEATQIERKDLSETRQDRFVMQSILEELKKISSASRVSVALQDSMNTKQDKLVRNQ